ncbi:MAG: hypothetical protein AB8B64_19165 [Granulosicoccus sp.]
MESGNSFEGKRVVVTDAAGIMGRALVSSSANNITGTSLAVDGGNSAGTMDVFQPKKSAL